MKVGIMSMQRVLNYGSYLQALSLKNMIEELGHTVCFVDYKMDAEVSIRNNKLKVIAVKLKSSSLWINYLCKVKNKILHKGEQKDIYKEAFEKAMRKIGIDEKRKYHVPVDVLVIGSDEVFNCLQRGFDMGFSMELFGKNNRAKHLISYAASFGNTTYERLKKYGVDGIVAKYLNRFDRISVRDNNSAKVVKKLCNIDVESHFDPVLVGNIEKRISNTIHFPDKPYILVYGYGNRFLQYVMNTLKEMSVSKLYIKKMVDCPMQGIQELRLQGENI